MGDLALMLIGLALLITGAAVMVRGSTHLAAGLGIPPLVIGLTVVAVGTSAPELVASVLAALANAPGIAIGNIIGSNISNSLLVAGATAIVMPVAVSKVAAQRDGMLSLTSTAFFWLVCAFGMLNAGVGTAMLLALGTYIFFAYRSSKADVPDIPGNVAIKSRSSGRTLAIAFVGVLVGVAVLALGGRLLVDAAVVMAADLGVSDAVIGLTIIAVGTSLPELSTSLIAALRGKSDMAFGNIIGSNIINVLGIGGLTAILAPMTIPPRLIAVDFPVMVVAAVVLLLFAATGRRIGRSEGLVLLVCFVAYVTFVWRSTG